MHSLDMDSEVAIFEVKFGLSAFFGSAIYGTPWISDWTLNAAQACIWLAMAVFLGYFLAGCWNEIRSMR